VWVLAGGSASVFDERASALAAVVIGESVDDVVVRLRNLKIPDIAFP
jgi:hypothetical protein